MKRLLLALLVVAVVGALVLGGGAAWVLYSESGFAWTLSRLRHAMGDALVLEGARGAIAGEIVIARIRYAHEGTTVEARQVVLRVAPGSLIAIAPRVTELRCAELVVTPAATDKPAALPATLLLPLSLRVDQARLDRVVVRGKGDPLVLSNVAFAYGGDSRGHHLRDAVIELDGTRLTGQAEVGVARPYPVKATVEASRAPAPAARVKAELRGTLERLQVVARAASTGARLDVDATLTPYAPLPVERLDARLDNLDLNAFDAALPRTALTGTLRLGAGLAGELQIANALAGRYDSGQLPVASLAAAVRTDLAKVEVSKLRADLGAAGVVEGSGTVAPDHVTLALRTAKLDLSRLHGRLRPTRLAGQIEVSGTRASQSIKGELAEREARIVVDAVRAGDTVTLNDVRARARGGEARGHGRVVLAGAQPFAAEATLARFDPAAWGNFPEGAISGKATAKGTLSSPRVVEAQFTLDPSRLRGAPLTGSGRLSVRGEHVATVEAGLVLGGNKIDLRGALGGRGDVLTARIDAPQLAVVHPRWSGRAQGTAEIRGSLSAPDAKFDLRGDDLVLADWRAASLTAKGEYSARPDAPLRLDAAVAGLATPQGTLEQANLVVQGTLKSHTGTLRASGKSLDLAARGRGAWQADRGWSGIVEDVENRGPFPSKLESPVAVEVAAGRVRIGPIAAQIAGGRFDAKDSRYEQGRLASEGRFSQLPVSAVLTLAGLSPAAGGTLRVSGSWSLAGAQRWNGTVAIRRESGDVSVDTRNAVPMGIEALTLDARIVNDRVEFAGTLRARVASGRLEGSLVPVATPEGERITDESPLAFTASFEIARLAALSALTEATLRLDGRVRASLAGSGTLGKPLVSGTLEGDGIAIALPEEGVDLRGGELRAELAGTEVRVQSFSIHGGAGVFRASGTLAHGAGQRAALEWQAERLVVMARPDRRLVATGRGNAALEGGKVTLSGELRADEGTIELSARTLPAPGDDVVIAGRDRRAKPPTRLAQAGLDLALDFGERFRIRGRGLDTLLAGKIRVQTGPAGQLLADGTVRTVKGTYTAFGQKLALERGSLIFAGPIDNPTLDIRAMRKLPTVEAGVEVAGELRTPFVRVVGEPPMPENEALSWLILGHGPGDAMGTDLSMLPLAAAALLGQGGGESTGVAQRFGLDSIGMRSSTGTAGTAANQFITFGKRISDDIYVVYEQSLGATANVLKLEFNLTRRVLLRAETGEISAIGLFYRWAFD